MRRAACCLHATAIFRLALLATFLLAACKPMVPDGMLVVPFQDVRSKTLTNERSNLGAQLIETLTFNESTTWSWWNGRAAHRILEQGKNPGLGVRRLHAAGITGKGVNVAIIDQNIILDHPEFEGKILEYYDAGTGTTPGESSMHGPAVMSLLVGQNIGTAPGAHVYFAAAPSWSLDAQNQADALNWIIDENEKLPEDARIRVVSISAAPAGPGSPFTKNNAAWDAARKRAEEAGILVLDCTADHGMTAPCYLDLNDPDNISKCTPGWPDRATRPRPERIYVPTSRRTVAEVYNEGEFSYQYTGVGGLSWSVPYLAGVLALGWQVNPRLTGSELLDMLFASAYVRDGSLKIINPPAFIDRVRASVGSP